jgi:quinoprotein glucose dehydrogenase
MPLSTARARRLALAPLLLAPLVAIAQPVPRAPDTDWTSYGNDPGGARQSPLAQITRANVGRLAVAWRFSTGEASPALGTPRKTSFETTPLVVGGTMYVSTPLGRVFALDAATGAERWRYNAGVVKVARFGDFTNRGVSYWLDRSAPVGLACRTRIFLATIDARLIALDAVTGAPCQRFGDGGTVDLRVGLRTAPFEFEEYEVTSPPSIVGDATSPVTVLGGTARSSTGTIGRPVSRSSTNSMPVFVAWSTASTRFPSRRTVTSAGGDALS